MQSNLVDRTPALRHDGPIGSLKHCINRVEWLPVDPKVGGQNHNVRLSVA